MNQRFISWLVGINTSIILAAIPALTSVIFERERRIAVLESDMQAVKDGRLISMAAETRARFVDVEDRIETLRERITRLENHAFPTLLKRISDGVKP